MGIKVANNAFATLASGISNSATSITLTSGQGARFPSLGAGDYFYATLINTSNNLEIVKCTARSTDVLTVTRAQESTTARAYSAGDRIEIRLTAATFTDAVNEIGPTQVSDEANTSTGYFALPSGTTAQRPGTPAAGMVRHNTDTDEPEWYDDQNSTWRAFAEKSYNGYTVEYLVVAGGGAPGGSWSTGGGGGGGVVEGNLLVNDDTNYKIIIGAGATADQSSTASWGIQGSNSAFNDIIASGGGGGGGWTFAGSRGGSGGGGSSEGQAAGQSVYRQGFRGGTGQNDGTNYAGGGGGGAGGVGNNATSNTNSGRGGPGHRSIITGTLTYYGAGGAGGTNNSSESPSEGSTAVGTNGTANTGAGGGGNSGGGSTPVKGNGGSGIVVIRYAGSQRGSGGTVSTTTIENVSYTVHTFTSSGTFTA